MTIVTKDSLERLLADPNKVGHVIGRACVVLFQRQTASEQVQNDTNVHNGRGFTKADARSGTLTARAYMKHGTLAQWQIDRWLKRDIKGTRRISKYHAQLNEEAEKKAREKVGG